MLSGETAKGSYPIQSGELVSLHVFGHVLTLPYSVLMMAETCMLAEASIYYPPLYDEIRAVTSRPTDTVETVAIAAVAAAAEQNASAIIVLSTSGNTARLVSKYRPQVPIITGTIPDACRSNVSLTNFDSYPQPTDLTPDSSPPGGLSVLVP